jgi:hypothetical protein
MRQRQTKVTITKQKETKKKPKNRREKRNYLKVYLIEDTGLSGCALR